MDNISYRVVFSSRKTLGISILRDGSVVVRAPYRTPANTITRLVLAKASWIRKHTGDIRSRQEKNPPKQYADGEKHLYRGNELVLRTVSAERPYCRFTDRTIEIGLNGNTGPRAVRILLYLGYTREAAEVFPSILNTTLKKFENQRFRFSRLVIRSMRSRWGSCSSKGVITLNTELIKLPDHLIEYVMIHELCHLKHHNHGTGFYMLLGELYPGWKVAKKEMRGHFPG